MSVESVNNSGSNTGLYTTGAAVVGAGAGVAAGYLTKPFLKDGSPTDSFIRKMEENVKSVLSPKDREAVESIENGLKEYLAPMMEASSVEECKSACIENILKQFKDVDIDTAKFYLSDYIQKGGFNGVLEEKAIQESLDKVNKVTNFDELKAFFAEDFDKTYAGKNIDQIHELLKKSIDQMKGNAFKKTFESYWDSSKKQFVNCEEGVGAAIKKTARSIQGKYAMIYGAIGAGVLGLGTYLCCRGKKSPQPEQKEINTQA